MNGYDQLGMAGATLVILFFVVRYFVKAMDMKDTYNKMLTEKLVGLVEDNIASRGKLVESIDANTKATNVTTQNLEKLMIKILKR